MRIVLNLLNADVSSRQTDMKSMTSHVGVLIQILNLSLCQ